MSDHYDRYNGMDKLLGTNFADVGTDCISRQAAIDATKKHYRAHDNDLLELIAFDIEQLPSAQPEQTEMIKEIRKWINSANRGNTDYFIVDKIEEIINRYE